LIIDDSGDSQGREATITAPPPNDPTDPYTSLSGLAPGSINWVLGAGSVIDVRGGKGATIWNVESTPAGPPITLIAGTGINTFQVGDATHSLDGLLGSVTLTGNGGNSSLILNDSATTTVQNDDIYTDHFSRSDATGFSCAAVKYSGLTGITFYVGGSVTEATGVAVMGSAANVPVTVYGHAGTQTQLAASTLGLNGQVAFLSPVVFHGQDYYDFGAYYDYFNTAPTTYTLSTDPALTTRELVQQPGSVPVGFDGVTALILYARAAGGNQINVQSVAQGVGIHVAAGNSDVVTLGSLAPQLGGTLANFHAPVDVTDEGSTNLASLIIDDSGDTQARNVTIDPPLGGPYHPETTLTGLTPAPTYLNWVLGDGSPVTILGGSGGSSFVIHGSIPNVALTIHAGSGNNLLIAGLTAADLIGGSGNNILIGGTTDYDYNAAAIDAIMAELAQATAATFGSVVNALDTGANGLPALNANTVHSNGLANQLTGGGGLGWFFASSMDQALDFTNGDVFTMIQ
jgi:hypothetical protein